MKPPPAIFLSPHFDDVALSCGGLVWDLTRKGHMVKVWTIIGGFPPDEEYSDFARQNHLSWGISGREAILTRREEDHTACEILGAQSRYFDWPDVIYRRDPHTGKAMVNNDGELLSKPPEQSLVEAIAARLKAEIPENALLVCPMGLGNHLDHQAVIQAAERSARVDFYYADYPYILRTFDAPVFSSGEWEQIPHFLGQDALHAWQNAVLCYASQLSGLWRNVEDIRPSLHNYMAGGGGRLWQRKTPD